MEPETWCMKRKPTCLLWSQVHAAWQWLHERRLLCSKCGEPVFVSGAKCFKFKEEVICERCRGRRDED